MKTNCASCEKQINMGNITPERYFQMYGNYCLTCMARISKNIPKGVKESNKYDYASILKEKRIKLETI